MRRLAGFFLMIAAMTVVAQGCSKNSLAPLEKLYLSSLDYAAVDATFCASPPAISKQKIKYLFILDKSDSNQPGFPVVAGDVSNTDSNGNRRYGPLVQFLRDLNPDPNALSSFSMINFNDSQSFPSESYFVKGFDPDKDNFLNVVTDQWKGSGKLASPQPYDRGYTNYVSALRAALKLIQDDAQLEAGSLERPIVTSAYRIIFASDGVPTVPSTSGTSPTYTQDFTVDIQPVIDSILALKQDPVLSPYIGEIVLNTAYYFKDTQVPAAITLLQKMADEGNGQFMKFGAGENIMYGAFAPPIRNVKKLVQDVFVENENAVWWDDGRFLLDSDGDGLPDAIESALGSDPHKADTDGNGVSDLVEYRFSGKPCLGAGCGVAGRNPYSICDGLSPSKDASGTVTYPDTDRDGLNDCEEFVLKADRNKFDSNGDFIPDFLALKNAVPFIAGTNGSFAQPQGDGVTNYMKLKLGLPIQVPKSKIGDFKSRVTSLERVSSLGDRECFHFKADSVAILGPNNILRVFLVENSSVIDDKPSVRIAERRVDYYGDLTVHLSDGDFK